MTQVNLKMIIERKFISNQNMSINQMTDITFDILKNLYTADKEKHLSSESEIFLKCKNSSHHINNIVVKVFFEKDDIDESISSELDLILNENSDDNNISDELFFTNEKIKQNIVRRAGQLHAHLDAVDSNIHELGLKIDNFEVKEENYEMLESLNRNLTNRIIILEQKIMENHNRLLDFNDEKEEHLLKAIKHIISTGISTIVPLIVDDKLEGITNIIQTNGSITNRNIDKMKEEVKTMRKLVKDNSVQNQV